MNTQAVCVGLAIAMLSGCATGPKLPTIQGGETVAISVTTNVPVDRTLTIRNEAMGTGVSAGIGTGLVAGGLWGLACGPFAVLCVPLGAATGVLAGTAAGAAVGVTGAVR